MKFIIFLILIFLIPIISYKLYKLYKTRRFELFVSQISKSYDSNKFKQIVLDKMDNYDIELAIPSGQYLYNTVQGNWGFSTDETNNGVVFGVYRDGYTADGSIFKGKSGKRYKYMLEQGPYVIKYEVRHNNGSHDVSIYIDDKLVKFAKGEGISSDKIKVIGTNYHNYNNITTGDERGRRPVDYLKFVPKQANPEDSKNGKNSKDSKDSSNIKNIEGFNNNQNDEVDDERGDEREQYNFMTRMCEEEGLFCNKIQKFNIDLKTGKIHYNLDETSENNNNNNNNSDDTQEQQKQESSDADADHFLKHLFQAMDDDNDGLVSRFDLKSVMNEFYIRDELYQKVLNEVSPQGMDFNTFSSLIGQPVKMVLKNIYDEHGEDGLKMTYKILGYKYVEDKERKKQEERERKKRYNHLNKQFSEPEYDDSEPSKTRYRSDYKPQHPRPKNGVHFYDSIWDFNKY